MADTHTKKVRSFNMSQIKAKNTKPELIVRKLLFQQGYRYRIHDSKLAGIPDIVLAKFKTVIFVHGCFWHGHAGCHKFKLPQSNVDYWTSKIAKNMLRDKSHEETLIKMGWQVIVIWECVIKTQGILKIIENLDEQKRYT